MDSKNFLVVGGTSGIGLAIVHQLIADNNQTIILSRNAPGNELTINSNVVWKQSDVTDFNNPLPVIDTTLHGLVYCPGTINLKPFKSLKAEDFLNDFKVNLLGAVHVIQNYLPNFSKEDVASIVLFSTVAVGQGMAFHTSVASAKGAIEGFGKSLAAELAPKIRVNVIAPSLTTTPLANNLINNETRMQSAINRHPLKKIGKPEDIASLAVFLLSSESSWMTGQVIGIDGGLSTLK